MIPVRPPGPQERLDPREPMEPRERRHVRMEAVASLVRTGERVLEDLLGGLEHARGRVPWRQGRWVPVNPDWAFAPVLRARSALDPTRPLTAHSAALAGLAVACGLGFKLSEHQTPDGRPVQDAVVQLGPGIQELLHSATVAICGGVTVDRLRHAVPSFPTVSEVWLHLLEAYGL